MSRFKTLITGLSLGLLVGCIQPPLIVPKGFPPPIDFNHTRLDIEPTREAVQAYQEELSKYIRYLEQYYISLGVYYGTDTKSPVTTSQISSQCLVVEGIFKDTPLPKPPKTDDRYINQTLHALIDHIVDLRQRIRNNNAYMEELRKRYRHCM